MLIRNFPLIKQVTRQSYLHLLAVFVVVVLLLKISLVSPSLLNFGWFVIVLGLLGVSLGNAKTTPQEGLAKTTVTMPGWLLYAALGSSLLCRIVPYLNNRVPLGYDPGMYKFLFEHPLADQWPREIYPLLFSLLMGGLNLVFGWQFLLIELFIGLSGLSGLVLFQVTQKLFNRVVGILAALIFTVSIAQYQTFWFTYYKNVLGIILLLFSFLFFSRAERVNWQLILIGGGMAGIHQLAFFIFGLTYLVYVMVDLKRVTSLAYRYAVLNGILIIVLALLFNIDRIPTFLWLGMVRVGRSITGVTDSAGTFFDVETYFFTSIALIPLAITGLIHYWRRHIPLFTATLISLGMVSLKLFFYNRFIIYLDIFVIIYAALGFYHLIEHTNRYGQFISYSLLLLSLGSVGVYTFQAQPLISQQELDEISSINNLVEPDATIMATDGIYGPWLKGWVSRKIVAPGLFDENKMNLAEWTEFWQDKQRGRYLSLYTRPLYIHVGEQQPLLQFEGRCFQPILNGKTKLYRYIC